MKTDPLEYKFLALLNKEDEYYQTILHHITKHKAAVIVKNEMDSGIEFTLKFTDVKDLQAFRENVYPREMVAVSEMQH